MNKFFILLSTFFAFFINYANASDSWQIIFNKQVICKGKSDQENVRVVLKTQQLKKTDSIVIKYKTDDGESGWKRTFYINDSAEVNIKTINLNEQSGAVSFNASALKSLMDKRQPVFIYTMSLPKDRAKAAAIRVRRILLCRIEWN